MFQITHPLHVAKLGKNVLSIFLTLYTYIVILHSTVCECNQILKKNKHEIELGYIELFSNNRIVGCFCHSCSRTY